MAIWKRGDDTIEIQGGSVSLLENNFTFLDSIEANYKEVTTDPCPGGDFRRNYIQQEIHFLELHEGNNCVRVTEDDVHVMLKYFESLKK